MSQRRYNRIIVFIILFIVSVLIIFGALANPRLICDYCKRAISNGNYISVEDKYFHDDHFFCAECKKSLVDHKFFNQANKYYCDKCYDTKFIPKCQKCGESIDSRYFKFDEKTYHKKCYDKFIAPRCSLCQKIIYEEYLTDFWGNKYHRFHENNNPSCDYCRRFISEKTSKGGWVYDDGRDICGICIKSAIENIREAEKLMIYISQRLKRYGMENNLQKIKLQLVDKNRLARLSADRTREYSGLTKFERNMVSGKVVAENFNIYILHGMPGENFKVTMAHELMHVWLYSQAPMEMDPALTEGSCNYASYLLFQNDRSEQIGYLLNSMEKDSNEFYGDGYRRVKKMVRRMGVEAWLKYLKDNKNFPSGY